MYKIERQTHKLDATGKAAGRLASNISLLLRGKNKTEFDPSRDMGDIVEVINIKKLQFTGKKIEQKQYFHYSGYPGGLKTKNIADVLKSDPARILQSAVFEMLPPVKFRVNMMKRLIIK